MNSVDPTFLPIGNVNISKGMSTHSHEINWKFNKNESAHFFIITKKLKMLTMKKVYEKNSYISKLKLQALVFKTTHEIRYDDIASSENYKETPKKIYEYNNDIILDNFNDRWTLSNRISQKNESVYPQRLLIH